MSISTEEKDRYLREAAIVLAREGFHTDRTHTGGLRVLLDGKPLCEATENGGITYRNEDIDEPERLNAKDKVYEVVRTTAEYTPATGDTGVMLWVVALPVAAVAAAFVLKRKKREE